jgi:hypothetical protein
LIHSTLQYLGDILAQGLHITSSSIFFIGPRWNNMPLIKLQLVQYVRYQKLRNYSTQGSGNLSTFPRENGLKLVWTLLKGCLPLKEKMWS